MATLATGPIAREPKPAVFFGWRVVAAAFTVLFVAYGIQFSFGVFVKQITDDMGWSRAQVLLPYAVYVALYSALSAVAGWATDRFGPGRVVAVGGVVVEEGWAGSIVDGRFASHHVPAIVPIATAMQAAARRNRRRGCSGGASRSPAGSNSSSATGSP